MTNKIRVLLITFLLLFFSQAPATTPAQEDVTVVFESVATAKSLDPRAKMLQAYLASRNSPLQNHAQDFIDAADQYNMDWKLVAAISGVESTFGKHIPGGYNGWGWGVYGDQALGFTSWKDGIFTVSEGLRTNYLNKGLTDPYAINRKYAASASWGKNVTFFLNDMAKFEQKYQTSDSSLQLAYLDTGINTNASGNATKLSTLLP